MIQKSTETGNSVARCQLPQNALPYHLIDYIVATAITSFPLWQIEHRGLFYSRAIPNLVCNVAMIAGLPVASFLRRIHHVGRLGHW